MKTWMVSICLNTKDVINDCRSGTIMSGPQLKETVKMHCVLDWSSVDVAPLKGQGLRRG